MKKFLMVLVVASLAFAMSACSPAATTQFKAYPAADSSVEGTDLGRIYVLRPPGGQGKTVGASVSADGLTIGVLGPESYLAWDQVPGAVKVKVQAGLFSKSVDVDVEAGKEYYLEAKVQNLPFVGIKPRMEQVPSAGGKAARDVYKPGTVQ